MRKVIVLAGLMLLAGCGVTGTASKSAYPKLTNDIALTKRVGNLTVSTGEGASDNASHGAFNWGAFSDEDVVAIKTAAIDAINNKHIQKYLFKNKHTNNINNNAKEVNNLFEKFKLIKYFQNFFLFFYIF